MALKNTELCDYSDNFGSDKSPKGKVHSYTQKYFKLFSKVKDNVKAVLEIGIGTKFCMGENYNVGASLFMWKKFFKKANIYGVDIAPEAMINDVPRISTFVAHQEDGVQMHNVVNAIMKETKGKLDIVIDDGSHAIQHQLATLIHLFPILPSGCTYVIEDVNFVNLHLFPKSGFVWNEFFNFCVSQEWCQKNVIDQIGSYEVCDMRELYPKRGYENDTDDCMIVFVKK